MRRLRPLRLVALILVGLWTQPASARHASERRSVAVLEHRAGVTRAAHLAERMAAVLARASSLMVVDPKEARRRLPGELDAQVAACSGEPQCIAAIGSRIGVDEVILVGISHLGDTVLELQRVSVASRTIEGRTAEALPSDTEPNDAFLLAFLQRLLPPSDFRRFGEIRVHANVSGATILLDGAPKGKTPSSVRVEAPRRYQLTVSKKGFLDFHAVLDVQPDGVIEVNPTLQRRSGALPWYQRWWVWTIVGGVVAATATTLTIVFWPTSDTVPVYVRPGR